MLLVPILLATALAAADDLDRQLFQPEGQRPPLSTVVPPAIENMDHPLAPVAQRMRQSQQRIGQADVGPGTQELQQEIVRELDRLIAQSQCQSACSSSEAQEGSRQTAPKPGQSASKPAAKPEKTKPGTSPQAKEQPGVARHADMEHMRTLLKELWGELPEKQREQVYQSPVEEFLPQYETMIEQYFRRLAEESGKQP